MTSAFIDDYIFSDCSSSLVCSSLATFSCDFAIISLRLQFCEACHWYLHIFLFFFSSIANNFLS